MKLSINPGQLPSVVHVPPSKSYANRALILAALKPGQVTLKNIPEASDVTFLIDALKRIGLELEVEKDVVHIANHFPQCEGQGCEIKIGEGGTTARFLASMLVLGSRPYTLVLGNRLKNRPWQEFTQIVNSLGGRAELNEDKLLLQGPVKLPNQLEVDCSQTTQFASGFQLACAFSRTEIIPKNLESSQSYWEMTKSLIEFFRKNREYEIPLDWSSASYPMAFAALKHKIQFPLLKVDEHQADSKFLFILRELNAVFENVDGIIVKPGESKKDFILDVSDCLDLVPTLCFFLSHIEGTHRLSGTENLVHKESDRLSEVMKLMEAFGLKSHLENSTLIIEGSHSVRGERVDLVLPDDHRMIMSAALFLRFHEGGSVTPAEAVDKSYPTFFSLFK